MDCWRQPPGIHRVQASGGAKPDSYAGSAVPRLYVARLGRACLLGDGSRVELPLA
ncbi:MULTISPECIES: hypothetical protein [unclassified Terrabacter]|uniref:hypothetical protein n=1 Tax=unclassified Terrabacter TaxID=2630222 RepID=UPI000AB9D1AA|nr:MULTISPECIES: hypothetical protein [unclassified Terrabacter]